MSPLIPKENILLSEYTTFQIGGPARYFFNVFTSGELIKAINFAKDKKLPYFLLGGGSNLLVGDNGYEGVIIKLENNKYQVNNNTIFAEAGVRLSEVLGLSLKNNLTGLEWAIGIPGTIAGAVRGNSGAFGQSISQSVKEVDILNEKLQISTLNFNDCFFAYRESIFKKTNNIILSVKLGLKEGKEKEIRHIIKENSIYRKGREPAAPSAGCIFKNYQLKNGEESDPLLKKFPEFKDKVKGGKIGVGRLIDQCGLKGKKNRQAMISNEHANFIINLGGAKAKDVIELMNLIRESVKNKFDLGLQEEVVRLGC